MRSYRVYSSLSLTVDEQCDLDERASHHLARVLRVKTGDRLSVFNGDGNNYQGAIVSATKHQVSVLIDNIEQANTESSLNTCLARQVFNDDSVFACSMLSMSTDTWCLVAETMAP